jgi:hypothetical protein
MIFPIYGKNVPNHQPVMVYKNGVIKMVFNGDWD